MLDSKICFDSKMCLTFSEDHPVVVVIVVNVVVAVA